VTGSLADQTRELIGSREALARDGFELHARTSAALQQELQSGFSEISCQLGDVSRGLRDLDASFRWGFSGLLAGLGGLQDSLEALIQIAKTPAQTAAFEHFENARQALRQGMYPESLEELGKAIGGVPGVSPGYELEWRFHQLQGIVRLGSFDNVDPDVVDQAQAEQAFLLAARYAKADSPKEAARALMSAGWAAYVQSPHASAKLADALKHTEAALALNPGLSEALFQAAKVHMSLDRPKEGLVPLRAAVEQDPRYLVKAASDGEFQQHRRELDAFLAALRKEKLADLQAWVRPALQEAEEWLKKSPELDRHPAVTTWRDVLAGAKGWGALDLIQYARERLSRDCEEVETRREGLVAAELVVRDELAAVEPLAKQAPSLARHEVLTRWQGLLARGGWTQKEAERVDGDRQRLQQAVAELRRFKPERRTVSVERQDQYPVEERYEEPETYLEEVEVKKGGWFSKPVTRLEERTRIVKKTRQVMKTRTKVVQEERPVWVNGLGEVRDTFVRIGPGTFQMGSPTGEQDHQSNETQHEVTLTRGFEIAVTPVTQEQWEALMGNNPSQFKGPDRPVERVSWYDAVAYCNALSRVSGLEEAYVLTSVYGQPGQEGYQAAVRWKGPGCPGYRLPTEAEWEYACCGGSTAARHGALDEVAWYDGNSGSETHPVMRKRANAWGLHDTLGNVWEWCWDWYGSYPGGSVTDPVGPEAGSFRVDRGGSWNDAAGRARAAYRLGSSPGAPLGGIGFRPSRSIP
jgi:formylglycine-generating enzyme required for sulfatase activity